MEHQQVWGQTNEALQCGCCGRRSVCDWPTGWRVAVATALGTTPLHHYTKRSDEGAHSWRLQASQATRNAVSSFDTSLTAFSMFRYTGHWERGFELHPKTLMQTLAYWQDNRGTVHIGKSPHRIAYCRLPHGECALLYADGPRGRCSCWTPC